MTDGDRLRKIAEHLRERDRMLILKNIDDRLALLLDAAQLLRLADRLDAWDQELKHIAVENSDEDDD